MAIMVYMALHMLMAPGVVHISVRHLYAMYSKCHMPCAAEVVAAESSSSRRRSSSGGVLVLLLHLKFLPLPPPSPRRRLRGRGGVTGDGR